MSIKSNRLQLLERHRSSRLRLSAVPILTLSLLSACAWLPFAADESDPIRQPPPEIKQAPSDIDQRDLSESEETSAQADDTGTLTGGDGQGIGGTGVTGASEDQEERS
ncbi:MAG: hypothetical protein AAF543_20090, partial [Pseudomonadota bacterium]